MSPVALVLALAFLAEAAPPAAQPAAPPAPAAAPAKAPPLLAIEAYISQLKGKSDAPLTAQFGPPETVQPAVDGRVNFWTFRMPAETVCKPVAGGQISCGRVGGEECLVAVAVNPASIVMAWRVSGNTESCAIVLSALKPLT